MAKKKSDEKVNQNPQSDNEDGNSDDKPNFEDPEDFVDDITDEELLGDLLEQRPQETDGVENIIVVDGAPQVGPERVERLKTVINKIFHKYGKIVNEYYPTNESGLTTGYIIFEYDNAESAAQALKFANNCKLDKQHTLLVNLFSDFKKYADIPKEFEPPAPQPFKVQSDLQWYLMDPDAYDQYLVGIGTGVSLQIWQNGQPEPSVLQDRPNWSETYAAWSPLGTYLATFHWRGVALWAGPNFTQFQKFAHADARFIAFSPCEKYLVTFSPNNDRDDKKLIIWDVRTGQEKRSFPPPEDYAMWPIFRWSKDDKFFARIGQDMLSVYETPSFGLLEKKSLKIPGIRDFQWSPTDNTLAYWVAEDKDVPARVTLLELPNRTEVRSKNLFSVADCKIHWQKSGDYLCVKVDRYAKVKKDKSEPVKYSGMYYNFEIFHMREKEIPVDSVEIKEPIQAFAWEPVGSKFSIIHGDPANICISFYQVNTGQAPTLLKKFEKKPFNHLFWSPTGQFIVLANLGLTGGALEFLDTNDFTIMNVADHYQMSGIEWDPTGRYVVTGVSSLKCKMDCGYYIWSFQGKILRRVAKEGFAQFLWRPRPATLLTDKQQREIKKNLKKYYAQFESKDRIRTTRASKELVAKRTEMMKRHEEYRSGKMEEWLEQKSRRLALRNYVDTDELDSDTKNVEEEIVEFFVKEETTVIE